MQAQDPTPDPMPPGSMTSDDRDELLALLAHELRTPLVPLEGFVDTVLRHYGDQLGPDAERLLRVAARNTMRLRHVLEEVLATTRVLTGRSPVVERVPLARLVTDVAQRTGMSEPVVVDVPDDVAVTAGSEQLRLLLHQLLENAEVHGAPPVRCTARTVGDMVELRVTDAGPGIEPDFVDRMFEGFTKPGYAGRHVGGLGLGLRMVAAVARLMGGEVSYEEVEPSGACFVVRLPVALDEDSAGARGPLPGLTVGRRDGREAGAGRIGEGAAAGRRPEPTPADIRRAIAEAQHRLQVVDTVAEGRWVLAELVTALGGTLDTSRTAGDDTLVIDISLGSDEPVYPRATGVVRQVLERQLPDLTTMARAVLARPAPAALDPPLTVDLLAVDAVQHVRRDLERRFARGDSMSRIIDELVRPTLVEIGDRWATGTWSVADQKASTVLLEGIVATLELRQRRVVASGQRVTMAGVPGDAHELPGRLLALELMEADVAVRWTGGALPAHALDRDLREHRPDALLLSCGLGPLLGGAVDLVEVAARQGIPVVLGGNGVARHPDVAEATRATVGPTTAQEVVELLPTLRPPPERGTDGWARHSRPVRSLVLRELDDVVAEALTTDELSWLVESIALARWRPTAGATVLEDYLGLLRGALGDRDQHDVDVDALGAWARKHAAASA